MNKRVIGANVYYGLGWSRVLKYDKHEASRILPEMPGLILFTDKDGDHFQPVLCFATWREGLREGMRNLFDPYFSRCPLLMGRNTKKLYYKFAVIDSSKSDLLDLFYWVIREYDPLLNTSNIRDSKRYEEISVREVENVANPMDVDFFEFK